MSKLTQINGLLKRGHSLQGIGINNWAFSKDDALDILNKFEELQVSILGGDVCDLKDNSIQPNYDNWYCNRLSNETDVEFSKRSIKKAKNYIANYNVNNLNQVFFSFVLEKPSLPNESFRVSCD